MSEYLNDHDGEPGEEVAPPAEDFDGNVRSYPKFEYMKTEIMMKPIITKEDVEMMSDLLDSVLNRYRDGKSRPNSSLQPRRLL